MADLKLRSIGLNDLEIPGGTIVASFSFDYGPIRFSKCSLVLSVDRSRLTVWIAKGVSLQHEERDGLTDMVLTAFAGLGGKPAEAARSLEPGRPPAGLIGTAEDGSSTGLLRTVSRGDGRSND